MRKFSTDAAGFAAFTLCELMLQQCVINGLFSPDEAKRLLALAARRHEEAAEGADEKIALNMEAAHLLRLLASGLEPLFRDHRQGDVVPPAAEPPGKSTADGAGEGRVKPPARPNWVAFPD